jgi:hypothetical protein
LLRFGFESSNLWNSSELSELLDLFFRDLLTDEEGVSTSNS